MTLQKPLARLAAFALFAAVLSGSNSSEPRAAASCQPDLDWSEDVAREETEKKIGAELGTPPPCHFHSFAWQWFLHLMRPVSAAVSFRNFEDDSKYFVLGVNTCPECKNKELAGYNTNNRELSGWFIRGIKAPIRDPTTNLFSFLETKLNKKAHISICDPGNTGTDQPGSEQALHDKFGKIVFYRVYYRRNLCTIYGHGGRVGSERVLETKVSWRQIEDAEKDRYVHRVHDLPGIGRRLLGIVGVHIAIDTSDHPGLIWATFEHKQNAADCEKPTSFDNWSFTNTACAKCLGTRSLADCGREGQPCDNINMGLARRTLSRSPITHVCRLHPSGGADRANQAMIAKLNQEFIGPSGLLTGLLPTHSMAVLRNYFHVGTLWLIPHGDPKRQGDQKGSALLANTTLESFQQHRNCFSCHKPVEPKLTYPVSHILPRP